MIKEEFFKELLSELSYRSEEGYPILSKDSHIDIICEILDEWDLTEIKNELIQTIPGIIILIQYKYYFVKRNLYNIISYNLKIKNLKVLIFSKF